MTKRENQALRLGANDATAYDDAYQQRSSAIEALMDVGLYDPDADDKEALIGWYCEGNVEYRNEWDAQ